MFITLQAALTLITTAAVAYLLFRNAKANGRLKSALQDLFNTRRGQQKASYDKAEQSMSELENTVAALEAGLTPAAPKGPNTNSQHNPHHHPSPGDRPAVVHRTGTRGLHAHIHKEVPVLHQEKIPLLKDEGITIH